MSNSPLMFGTRLVLGSEVSSGVTKVQTLPYDNSLLGGLGIINGPLQVGVAPLASPPLGTIMVGPNPPTSGPPSVCGLHIIHPTIGMNVIAPIAANFYGVHNTYGFQQAFGSDFSFGLKQTLGVFNKVGRGVEVGGTTKAEPEVTEATPNRQTSGNWNHAGTITASNFQGTINPQAWKGFDIKHPRKPNRRIRHICVEGPEAAIYVRGTLKGSNVIELPEYWDGLIDIESITVHLTPIGNYQELYVDKIEWGKKVIVKNNQGSAINCYYKVEAARIDGEPLIVEYEGETPADYPGDPTQYSISGHDYGRKD